MLTTNFSVSRRRIYYMESGTGTSDSCLRDMGRGFLPLACLKFLTAFSHTCVSICCDQLKLLLIGLLGLPSFQAESTEYRFHLDGNCKPNCEMNKTNVDPGKSFPLSEAPAWWERNCMEKLVFFCNVNFTF